MDKEWVFANGSITSSNDAALELMCRIGLCAAALVVFVAGVLVLDVVWVVLLVVVTMTLVAVVLWMVVLPAGAVELPWVCVIIVFVRMVAVEASINGRREESSDDEFERRHCQVSVVASLEISVSIEIVS